MRASRVADLTARALRHAADHPETPEQVKRRRAFDAALVEASRGGGELVKDRHGWRARRRPAAEPRRCPACNSLVDRELSREEIAAALLALLASAPPGAPPATPLPAAHH